MTATYTLHVTDLSTRRGDRHVSAGIDVTLRAGEALVLAGPNGAGKTTLLRTIAGFLSPAEGVLALTGPGLEPDMRQSALHYVGHRNALKAGQSVQDNVQFWARFLAAERPFAGLGDGLSVAQALGAMGLGELGDVAVGDLSAGQQRRAALARLLCAPRPLWLLDEPTVSLDQEGRALLARMIAKHRGAGGLCIAATHIDLGLEGAKVLRLQLPDDEDEAAGENDETNDETVEMIRTTN
ncbi:MAG: heme ABC exporter ATP-binding protein CcmA [Pseudomonadota bacterium]